MSELIVKEIMTEFVQTIPTNASVFEASQIMAKLGIGSIVVTQRAQPAGMLTERDIVTKVVSQDLDPVKVSVGKIMSNPIISIKTNEIISEAALMMSIYKIRRLVVVGQDGSLAGIVTATDIAWYALLYIMQSCNCI